MKVFQHGAALRAWLAGQRCAGRRIALVPTMGNLHRGHLRLVERARMLADVTVASIFVNPTQFGPDEDYQRYPRTLEADLHALREAGCSAVFTPSVEEMYPQGLEFQTRLSVPQLAKVLCGASRPGHFDGVCLVVARLFHLISPDVALFGDKDRQQQMIIRTMCRDLAFPVTIEAVPTCREPDGLAMSSRNRYLSPPQRQQAPELFRTLRWMVDAIRSGRRDYRHLEQEGRLRLKGAGFRVDYLSIRRLTDLNEATGDEPGSDLAVFAAAFLGSTRLIDNLKVEEQYQEVSTTN